MHCWLLPILSQIMHTTDKKTITSVCNFDVNTQQLHSTLSVIVDFLQDIQRISQFSPVFNGDTELGLQVFLLVRVTVNAPLIQITEMYSYSSQCECSLTPG